MTIRTEKIGVNAPCPCGQKRPDGRPMKYKKCCMRKEQQEKEDIVRIMTEVMRKRDEEQATLHDVGIFINYVKPCTYTNPNTGKNVKAWALGNRLFHTRPEHETFHDFIIDHLRKDILGQEWWIEQLQAPQKHFLFQCFVKWDEWSRKNATEANKVDEHTWFAVTDGWAKTLSSLAFDICSLEHTQQLPNYLLRRLKNHGEYQGAHYEIAVAAIFSRLGCKIDFLDKEKITTRHCEFIATHDETGVSIAVEAKSRQRPGVKHMTGIADEKKLLRGDVKRLFDDALKQNPKDKPFVIFIDINCPLTPDIRMDQKPWFNDIKNMLSADGTPTLERPDEYTAVFFTNYSPHYQGESDAQPNEYLTVIPFFKNFPLPNQTFAEMLSSAVQHYGYVPNIVESKPATLS